MEKTERLGHLVSDLQGGLDVQEGSVPGTSALALPMAFCAVSVAFWTVSWTASVTVMLKMVATLRYRNPSPKRRADKAEYRANLPWTSVRLKRLGTGRGPLHVNRSAFARRFSNTILDWTAGNHL